MRPLPQNAVKERASEGNKDGWLTCAPQKVDPAVRDLPFCGSQPLNLRQVRTSSRPWRALDQNVLVRYDRGKPWPRFWASRVASFRPPYGGRVEGWRGAP